MTGRNALSNPELSDEPGSLLERVCCRTGNSQFKTGDFIPSSRTPRLKEKENALKTGEKAPPHETKEREP